MKPRMAKQKEVTLPSGAKVSIPDDGQPFELLKFAGGEGVKFGSGAQVVFRTAAPSPAAAPAAPAVSPETIATGVVKVIGPILKAQRERLDALEKRIRELEQR